MPHFLKNEAFFCKIIKKNMKIFQNFAFFILNNDICITNYTKFQKFCIIKSEVWDWESNGK